MICFTWDSDGVAIIVEKLIAKCLYSRLGLNFAEDGNWTLIHYAAMRRRLGLVTERMDKEKGSIQSDGVPERKRMEETLREQVLMFRSETEMA